MKLEINDMTNHGKDYFRISLFKISVLTILVMSLLLFKTIQAYSNEKKANTIYTKVLGFSLPSLEACRVDEKDDKFIYKVKDEVKAKSNVIGNEISYFKGNEQSYPHDEFSEDSPIQSEEKNLENIKDIDNEDNVKNGGNSMAYILNESSVKKLEKSAAGSGENGKPRVLIYHTHTQEAYYPVAGKDARSKDNNCNVVAAGEKIKKVLEEQYNIQVIHDKTIHDENYSKCYYKSRETVQQYLSSYGDFDLIIDLHRDSLDDKTAVTGTIGNDSIAKCMFVMCTGCKYYENQKNIVDNLVNIAKLKYPALLRGNEILTRNRGITYYNQDLNKNAILIECGANVNTIDEVLKTAGYMADVLGQYITNK